MSHRLPLIAPELLRKLYPPILPYSEGKLQTTDGLHSLFYEESGNSSGNPVVVLHGGPGGGCAPFYRQYFNPEKYRIILFDQRGAGKSEPHASLENNTTWHLVEDIELIRTHLNIEKWIVFGGSWGSTLALCYAESHPDRVKALILRGIFTLRRSELMFFYQSGASHLFPDYWDQYVSPIPEVERFDFISAYYRRLTGTDDNVKRECAKAWTTWEMATSQLNVNPESISKGEDDHFALAFARIESHYFVNGGFFKEDGQLLKNAHIIKDIPGTIVQGRYDVVCPATTAWELHKVWPIADLKIVTDAGHSCKEPGIVHYLVEACDKYADL